MDGKAAFPGMDKNIRMVAKVQPPYGILVLSGIGGGHQPRVRMGYKKKRRLAQETTLAAQIFQNQKLKSGRSPSHAMSTLLENEPVHASDKGQTKTHDSSDHTQLSVTEPCQYLPARCMPNLPALLADSTKQSVKNLAGKKIAVTGATGFLGRYVVTALQNRGAIPIGVVRNPDRVPELRDAGVELRRADLGDLEALQESFAGCDAIASVAAMINIGSMYSIRKKQRAAYIQTNVGGIERVMKAATACGVRRVVHVSSANVYRDRTPPVDENAPLHKLDEAGLLTNNYSISKAAAEECARQMAGEHDLDLTILRPTGIYGAHDLNFMRWVRLLLRPPITLWPAGTHLQLVHGADVAEALMLSLENDRSIGEAYNVCGGSESLWDFAEAWKKAEGPRARWMIPIPVPLAPLLENGKIGAELGWQPRDTVTCLRETFAATKDQK